MTFVSGACWRLFEKSVGVSCFANVSGRLFSNFGFPNVCLIKMCVYSIGNYGKNDCRIMVRQERWLQRSRIGFQYITDPLKFTNIGASELSKQHWRFAFERVGWHVFRFWILECLFGKYVGVHYRRINDDRTITAALLSDEKKGHGGRK